MNKTIAHSMLLASLMTVAAVASAQVPNTTKGGEATTQMNGRNNGPDKSPRTSDTTRAEVRNEAAAMNKSNGANSTTPQGEASTTGPAGQPNAAPAGTAPSTMGGQSSTTTRDMKRAEGKAATRATPREAEKAK